MNLKQLNLLSVIFFFSIFTTTGLCATYHTPQDFDYPYNTQGSFPSVPIDTMTEFIPVNSSWYLVYTPTGVYDDSIHVSKWDYYFTTQSSYLNNNMGTGTVSSPVSCGIGGGATYVWYKCDDLHLINSTHADLVCTESMQTGAGDIYQVKYVQIALSSLIASEFNLDSNSGSCSDITGRLSEWGTFSTGTFEPHIAFVNYLGVLKRIRDFVDGGTPTYETYPMPSISALYNFQPLSAPTQSHPECYHDGDADCGSQLIYVASTPADTNKRIYLNEYKANCVGFCTFELLEPNYYSKKLITDQEISWFDIKKITDGYELVYEDDNTGDYWLALFDKNWNLVTKAKIEEDYGSPYKSAFDATVSSYSCGFSPSCWIGTFSPYNISNTYDQFRFNCRYNTASSTASTHCIITVTEIGNPTNTQTIDFTIGANASSGWHNYWNDFNLSSTLIGTSVTVKFNLTNSDNLTGFNPYISFFFIGEDNRPKLEYGVESSRFIMYSAKKGNVDLYDRPYITVEEETCTCNPYSKGSCVGAYRKYTRVCYPSGCDDEAYYEYDEDCLAGICTPAYLCYNSTHLCLYNSSCYFDLSDCTACQFYCNQEVDACYDSPNCLACPNDQMTQRAFPDCSCYCDNFCTLGYEDLDISCACKSMTLDTQSWQDNPVSMFQELSSGVLALFGGLAIPFAILVFAIAIAGIITQIFKKSL